MALTQVRHGKGRDSVKPFRISSGYAKVYTTFLVELKMPGKADAEPIQQFLLLGSWLRDSAKPDLMAVGGGQHDIGALQRRQQRERRHGRVGLFGIVCFIRRHWRLGSQPMLQRDPQRIAKKSY